MKKILIILFMFSLFNKVSAENSGIAYDFKFNGIDGGEINLSDYKDKVIVVVNVASRLESIAVPGSVLVSKETVDKLEISKDFELVSLGMQSLKGVGRLIEVYAIKEDSLVVPKSSDFKDTKVDIHDSDEVPAIAIIPFENKGADEDVFYAYGISADLISDCSSAGIIRVISLKDVEKIQFKNMSFIFLRKFRISTFDKFIINIFIALRNFKTIQSIISIWIIRKLKELVVF